MFSSIKGRSVLRTVLITGCSEGGLGAALAKAFHGAGLHVYATARDPTKMASLAALGIETLTMDVQSPESIRACAEEVASRKVGLDILINNAGATYAMPVSDTSILTAKALFDLNVWSYLEVSNAFLPLLIESKGMLVNQTSIASVSTVPFQSSYNASKAAIASYSDHQRIELRPFGVRVVDLKTGGVKSNINANARGIPLLPDGSLYIPAREKIEEHMAGVVQATNAMDSGLWANEVVKALMKKNPPATIWKGKNAAWARFAAILPLGTTDVGLKMMTGLDRVDRVSKRENSTVAA